MVSASLWVGFTLPGMIDEPGSFSGSRSSPRPARGPDPSQRMSFAIFMRLVASVLSAPEVKTVASWPASAANLFGALDERQARQLRDPPRDAVGELRVAVQAGAHGRAAERDLVQPGQRRLEPGDVAVELRHVAAELLAERERHRVLEVRPADLDDVESNSARFASRASRRARTDGMRSSTIAMATAMCSAVGNVSLLDWLRFTWSFGWIGCLPPRAPAATSFARPAMTSLTFMFVWVPEPVCQTRSGNSPAEPAVGDLRRRRGDQLVLLGGQQAELRVDARGGELEDPEGADDPVGHHVAPDREVVERALGLRGPVVVGRYVDLAHRVRLGPGRGAAPVEGRSSVVVTAPSMAAPGAVGSP